MSKLVFLSKHSEDASTRYRALQYTDHLTSQGYEVEHASLSGGMKHFLAALIAAYRADIVIVLRKTLPRFQLTALRWAVRRLVFDYDDAIFCRSDGGASDTRKQRFEKMAKTADMLFAGNHFLADSAKAFNSQIVTLPTSVVSRRYDDEEVIKASDHVDLVWIGSRSTSKYLRALIPTLEKAYLRNQQLRLKIIADFSLTSENLPILNIPWSEQVEVRELKSAHIGIAPMDDNLWTKGKCALKVLQYMAAELPVITVNVGVNGEAVLDAESGFLVNDETSWLEAIHALSNDEVLRKKMGTLGRQRVKDIYDIEIVANTMLSALSALLTMPKQKSS